MGVFDFLKKFSKEKDKIEEIKLDGLDNWVKSHSKNLIENVTSRLEKVKERILEYLAVQKRVGKNKGAILCLVGPPGVGKPSLG